MKFIAIAALLVGVAVAGPTNPPPAAYKPCPSGLYNTAECCDVDVLSLAAINCTPLSTTPKSASNYQAICAKAGKIPRCCSINAAGQALLCNKPVGITE